MPDQLIDLVVIGGGPAGTTLATLVKRYAPKRRVVLLEKAPGPRHHVGESLLPGLVPVLKEMGVFEKIDGAGFPKKIGANYVWGVDRVPWENDFNEIDIEEMIRRHGGIPERIEYAWNVRRSEYDEILLRHAEESGVEILRGAQAVGLLEDGGRATGVEIRSLDGSSQRLSSGMLADCSGQSGFLSRFRKVRDNDHRLKNVAAYAYFKNAEWKYKYSGHPDKTKIFVCSMEPGWFWYIPVSRDVVSVGMVTTVESLKARGVSDIRALYFEQLEACGEIWPLLKAAELVRDVEGTGKDFFTQSDWSYLSAAASGPGWLAAGDAALFVDPILSTGVTLAHLCGHRAAYTLLSDWDDSSAQYNGMLWKDYDRFCREAGAQYLTMAMFWYGSDRNAPHWWRRAGEIQRAQLPVELSDKSAFVTVSAGLTQYYDRLFGIDDIADDQGTRPEEYPFYQHVLLGALNRRDREGGIGMGGPARLAYAYRQEICFLPEMGKWRLKPVKRVVFLKHDDGDPVREALNPRKIVMRHHLTLLELIDGRRSLAEVVQEAAVRGAPEWWLRTYANRFFQELSVQGVLEDGAQERCASVQS